MGIDEAKRSIAIAAKRGIPMILSGSIFWLLVGVLSLFTSHNVLSLVYLFGIGLVFPIGILLSKILKIDLFSSGNPLGTLGGIVGGVQLFFVPIVIMVYLHQPAWIPFVIGVLTGAHFLPYAWIYNSKTYIFLAVGTTGVASFTGFFLLDSSYTVIPFGIVIIYLLTILGLIRENKRDR
ncbi:DUF7010 family protein [Caldalkalibacillus mannanilyticus]|uniref:DUF7010 family protein n=1 Tax=Caldalkalibacillus mannanilyticus TaxID=1418 RepID=UPI0004684537|nr:hypothetical protein [Caldalkalibacillus mannanilyticus]